MALIASETAVAVVKTAGGQLVGHFRFADQAAAHENQIRFAVGNGLFHHVRFVDACYGGDGNVHHRLDGGGKVHVAALLHKYAGRHSGSGVGMENTAGGHLDHIHIGGQHLGDLLALVNVVAALNNFVAGHTHVDGEVLAHLFPNVFQTHNGETAAILQASAVFVRPMVRSGGQELVDEPAVACMELHHIKAGVFKD